MDTAACLQQAKRERPRGSINSDPDAVLLVDESGKIVAVDKEFEAAFSYSRSEIVGQTLTSLLSCPSDRALPSDCTVLAGLDIVHADDVERIMTCTACDLSDMTNGVDLRGLRADGTAFDVLIRSCRVIIPSGIYTIVVTYEYRT